MARMPHGTSQRPGPSPTASVLERVRTYQRDGAFGRLGGSAPADSVGEECVVSQGGKPGPRALSRAAARRGENSRLRRRPWRTDYVMALYSSGIASRSPRIWGFLRASLRARRGDQAAHRCFSSCWMDAATSGVPAPCRRFRGGRRPSRLARRHQDPAGRWRACRFDGCRPSRATRAAPSSSPRF